VPATAPASPARLAHHPALGLAPFDVSAAHPAAAALLRREADRFSAGALKAAIEADPTLRSRYDRAALELLLHDAELLVERLAICLGAGDDRMLTDYAEWIGPIERRRGIVLSDVATLCAGLATALESHLDGDSLEAARHALGAAATVLRRNGRLAGDRHGRRAFFKWLYRGV